MAEQILCIVEEEIIPFILEGIAAGFALCTVFALLSYGICKSISLLGINNR
ncbi:MAG: hypothetical protein HFI51_04440 [Lachnospiraceae bacterium]|nr:hypothetical protein [Lachnospiraceae bacterium]